MADRARPVDGARAIVPIVLALWSEIRKCSESVERLQTKMSVLEIVWHLSARFH